VIAKEKKILSEAKTESSEQVIRTEKNPQHLSPRQHQSQHLSKAEHEVQMMKRRRIRPNQPTYHLKTPTQIQAMKQIQAMSGNAGVFAVGITTETYFSRERSIPAI